MEAPSAEPMNLTTQVSLATYVVTKQWHKGNQLVFLVL
jgi:hypothetical protein